MLFIFPLLIKYGEGGRKGDFSPPYSFLDYKKAPKNRGFFFKTEHSLLLFLCLLVPVLLLVNRHSVPIIVYRSFLFFCILLVNFLFCTNNRKKTIQISTCFFFFFLYNSYIRIFTKCIFQIVKVGKKL